MTTQTDGATRRSSPGGKLWRFIISFGEDPTDDPDRRARKQIFSAGVWASMAAIILVGFEFARQDAPWAVVVAIEVNLALAATLLVIRLWPKTFDLGVNIVVFHSNIGALIPTLLFGGLSHGGFAMAWGFVGVGASLIVHGPRIARIWLVALLISTLASAIIPRWIPGRYTLADPEIMAVIQFSAVLIILFAVLEYFVRERDRFQLESDTLLRNILPDDIAEQLKHDSHMIAQRFDSASVLFADVVDFTPMSASMTPEQLVTLLDDVFSDFDQLVEQYGLEKIKTIGDCYMVAAGVPNPRADHADALARLALDFRDHVATREYGGRSLRFRIGIASGPLVAGIIGRKKFVYDLWGDTVNTASRMESHGEGGLIQITRETHELIAGHFVCEPRGTIEVKGKGELPVWYLLESRPAPSVSS